MRRDLRGRADPSRNSNSSNDPRGRTMAGTKMTDNVGDALDVDVDQLDLNSRAGTSRQRRRVHERARC